MSTLATAGPVDNARSPHSTLRTLPVRATRIHSGFWAARQQTNREVSLPHGFAMLEVTNTLRNLRSAAGQETGDFEGFWFADSDVYKWLEAAAWELGRAPDPALQEMVESAIALVAAAQQPDGYLNSYFQITKPDEKWTDLDHGHELYCAGHLIQAAVAFHRAIGDDRLLDVALRLVDHIDARFGPAGRDGAPGHPEIEMALVELYRVTGDPRHCTLAQLFIDRRGRNRMRGHAGYGPVYQQDHVPLRQATEVAGHAVRQLYLTTGATDLYMETGEDALLDAMHTLWADMTERKMYITGGVGSRFDGESFGAPYELPPDTCYCETCAAIAGLMWNWRLLLVTGASRYADLFERTLYNGVLASPGLEGASYLYVNPLQVRSGRYVRASTDTATGAERSRPAWHNCACCPPNVMRLFASLHHYLATQTGSGVQVHQFASATVEAAPGGGRVVLEMTTGYPWEGGVVLRVAESPQDAWELALRVPAWARATALRVNGQSVAAASGDGYLRLARPWRAGDEVEMTLRLEPEWIVPNPRVDAVRGCVAVQRGPLVYCFESHDQPAGVNLLDVQVATGEPLGELPLAIAGGGVAVEAAGWMPEAVEQESLYAPLGAHGAAAGRARQPVRLTAIPYYAWGNRGMESMRVWMPVAPVG